MKIQTHKKGFTIVETLVAITILMIAIAGPLVVASKGLFGANLAKNQMTASYLAQESMEIVKNVRDNNLDSGLNWLNSLASCTFSAACDASAIDGVGTLPSIIPCLGGNIGGSKPCPIYAETNGYGHTSGAGATATKFTRKFYIHAATGSGACTSDDECGVTVLVFWDEGTTPYTVVLTSEITSTAR